MMDLELILKQYFGHDAFRPGQRALIEALLSGRDAVGVMPTGGGKSICYQLPALTLGGVTLVISPLISLMKDQVTLLRDSGIPAACVNSAQSAEENREALYRAEKGGCKLLYVAPERLSTEAFQRFARAAEIALVAVDEAHCVSQWGQDFRPSYLDIAAFVEALPRRVPVGAFTATATERVKQDIEALLKLRDPVRVTTGYDRPNLFFEVARPRRKADALIAFLKPRRDQSGIVYCATRKAVEEVCQSLIRQGFAATRYHAGLDDAERARNQEDFVYDRARVMVATNAFGMGIDKSNVSFVVHYNMPKDPESYYQEAGRAGRDGAPAHCLLLYSGGDVQTARFLIENAHENESLTDEQRETVRAQDAQRLNRMARYCRTEGCLRRYLLEYFGEKAPVNCGHCGNCTADTVPLDITVEAQKILSGAARIERRWPHGQGVGALVGMLRGSKDRKVLQKGLDALPTYGILSALSNDTVRLYVDRLIELGYLDQTEGQYPVVRLTEQARRVLFEGEAVTLRVRRTEPEPEAPAKRSARRAPAPAAPDGLYDALRQTRLRLAQAEGLPPFMVFSNATLSDMALRRPHTEEEFIEVSGVGLVKAGKYAEAFIEAIRDWELKNRF